MRISLLKAIHFTALTTVLVATLSACSKPSEEEQQKQQSESQVREENEKQLGKQEAEAILNALKADESNLKPRKYKVSRRIKLEKDW